MEPLAHKIHGIRAVQHLEPHLPQRDQVSIRQRLARRVVNLSSGYAKCCAALCRRARCHLGNVRLVGQEGDKLAHPVRHFRLKVLHDFLA